MNGSEKQIKWANDIIAEFKEAVNNEITHLEEFLIKRPDSKKTQQDLHELKVIADMDFDSLDALRILACRGAAFITEFNGKKYIKRHNAVEFVVFVFRLNNNQIALEPWRMHD